MTTESDDFDPAARELCPDGNCLGVIGANGRCSECGRASDGTAATGETTPARSSSSANASAADDDAPLDAISIDAHGPGWDDRTLCPDGNCVGVLDANGRCPVCGTSG